MPEVIIRKFYFGVKKNGPPKLDSIPSGWQMQFEELFATAGALRTNLLVTKAAQDMIIHQADCLHIGVANG